MEIFKAILIVSTVVATVIFTFCITLNVKAKIDTDKMIAHAKRSEGLVYELLKINFGSNCLFRNVYLPYNIAKNSQRPSPTAEIDLIIVMRGGVAIIEVKGMKGYINNPFRGEWHQLYRDHSLAFQNPFEQNEKHVNVVKNIMRQEQIFSVPIHNVVVFTERDVKFKYREEQLLTAETLIPYMKDLNKNRFMSRSEIKHTLKAIEKYRRRGPNVRRQHINDIQNMQHDRNI